MSLALLLDELAERRIELRVESGKLRFRAPEGALTPELKARLATEKEAILARLQGAPPPEPAVFRTAPAPAQERLWFIDQLQGPNSSYNILLPLRLRGGLDPAALRAALDDLVRRHQSLRSAFRYENGALRLEIVRDLRAPWDERDLSGLDEADRAAQLRAAIEETAEHRFDLGQPPLLRVLFARLGPEEHMLALNFHHSVTDGWSIGLVLREIAAGYEARRAGRAAALPPLAWQYADYIAWQEQLRQRGVMDADLAFWRERLAGAPACTTLPPDLRRPAVQDFAGASTRLVVDADLAAALRARAREWGVSLNHLTLAATAILLADFSGGRDLVIGLPLANRTRRELEPIVGMFVNVVPLRLAVDPTRPLSAFVAQIKRANAEALEHCQLPFERLVEALVTERDLSMAPVFQVAYNFLPPLAEKMAFGGLDAEHLEFSDEGRISKHDCTFFFDESAGRLTCVIEYSTRLYQRESAERWKRALLDILRALVAREDALLGEFPRTEPAAASAAAAWGAGPAHPLPEGSPWARFESVVRAQSAAVAVEDGGERVSYAALARRAGLVSARLAEQGIGRGARVGLLLPRSADLIAAMLGAVRRGAVFVPFDCEQPRERLATMVAKARLSAILCRTGEPAAAGLNVAAIGIDPVSWETECAAPEPAAPGAEDPIYMIFTSGSTGAPKAVDIPWRGLNNIVASYDRIYRMGPGERASQIASPGFDASLFEIWPVLLGGGTLVIVPDEVRLDPPALRDWLLRERITVHLSPTPLAEALLDLAWPEQAPLRLLTTGGQALRKRPRPNLPFDLLNNYGPTEVSIAVTSGFVAPAGDDAPLPGIGRPLDNTRLAILNEARRAVAPGAVGELYASGVGVALGYFDDPDATARNFVALADDPGRVWYRTGDLVRLRPDGDLEYLGRNDRQIKLRGHRIEPGEIESALLRLAGVRQAAVRLEGEQLVAYLEAEGAGPAPDQARRQLASLLPAAMIPAHFVVLDRLPRQSSGKIDLAAVPPHRPVAAHAPVAPAPVPSSTDALEAGIARAWAAVLATATPPGRDDNFFDLGGHSLLLVRLKEQIAAETAREISVLDLFRHPTIARQAEFLGGRANPSPAAAPRPRRLPVDDGIAIIGMAGRFPEADSIEEFWSNLQAGRDCVRRFRRDELLAAGLPAALVDHPDYVPVNGVLRDIDRFDAGFFGVSARDAEVMDPQQRLLLEEAWHAFEDAGYDPARLAGRVGVFVGTSLNGYLIEHVLPRRDIMESLGGFAVLINNDKDFAPTRISYKLGLRGPSVSVNTACSTSLVAVHQAVTALRDGQCELALAGGACARSRQVDGHRYEEGGVLSRDGRCRTFDAAATGMNGGNGVALVLLKPLAAALADGDHVYATIKGIAANNDGADKVGFTAPGVTGQSLVIRDALDRAGVDPQTVRYVEAHGTATQLGDTIEVAALAENYAPDAARATPLRLGSVKSNVGHLDAAAGAAGLIKTALCLHRRTLVPSLYFQQPNPRIPWPGRSFEVGTRTEPWERNGAPRRAAVSSLGIGGTNAHAVLEEAPPRAESPAPAGGAPALFLLSGRDDAARQANSAALAGWLNRHPATRLADAAHTLAFGRRHWESRHAVCAADAAEAAMLLAEPAPAVGRAGGIAFLFTGMGSQQPGMARALHAHAPVFRRCLDECAEILRPIVGLDIRDPLLAPAEDAASHALLNEHRVGQPAVFALEFAQATLWMALGLRPAVLIGHSLGEWVAACVAGVFALPDALRLVSLRGRLMDAQPPGAMLAVNLSEAETVARLPAGLEIATINASDQIVVAGAAAGIEKFAAELEAAQIRCKRLQVTLAAHSALMEPVLAPLRAAIAATPRQTPHPDMAVISNVTGRVLAPARLQDPDYWTDHLRSCVRFADGLATLWSHPELALLECGPAHMLCNLALRDPRRPEGRVVVASQDGDEATPDLEWRRFLESAGTLWAAGLPVDLEKLMALQTPGRRVPLPGYAFQRRRYWIEPATATAGADPIVTVRSDPPVPDASAGDATAATADANAVEQRVIATMRELLGPVRLGRTSDFFLNGGDSLLAVRLAARLGDQFGTGVTRAQVMRARTPARIAALLESNGTPAKDEAENRAVGCVVRLRAGNERLPPIVLIHAVGGGAFIYRELLQSFAPDHPVYGLQAPGLWDDDTPIVGLKEQARHYHACLRQAGIERPVFIGGSSYGGIVAYELDRLYRQTGHRAPLVVLFDSPGPGQMPRRLESEAEICAYLLARDGRHRDFDADLARLQALDHDDRFQLLLEAIRSNGQPQATPDDLTRQLRVFRQNLANMWDWTPEPGHDARLLFCKATEESALLTRTLEMAWVPLAGGGIEILPVPGDHSSMLSHPHARFLANELNRRLSAGLTAR